MHTNIHIHTQTPFAFHIFHKVLFPYFFYNLIFLLSFFRSKFSFEAEPRVVKQHDKYKKEKELTGAK